MKKTLLVFLLAPMLYLPCLSGCDTIFPVESEQEESTDTANDTKPTASEGLKYVLNDDSSSYSVTGIGTCTDTNVVIPETYDNLPVTSIGVSAFFYCTQLIKITISDSVTTIGKSAFSKCSQLTSITIPDGVTSIGESAFMYCDGLTSIVIPDRAGIPNLHPLKNNGVL